MIEQTKGNNIQTLAGGEVEQISITAVSVNKAGKDSHYNAQKFDSDK